MAAKKKSKKIRVTCEGASLVPHEQLVHFQGNLKSLANEDYQKLKKQITDLGFSEPVSVWRHEGKYYLLNGHQRCRTISRMVVDEGFECPPLPVSFVDAVDANEAKRKVLALTSQFGKIEKEGFYEFLQGTDIAADELHENFRFPEIDLAAFTEEFFVDTTTPGDDLDMAGGGGGDPAASPAGPVVPPPNAIEHLGGETAAHVKMVQLFFTPEQYQAFVDQCNTLAERYKTKNITDTVFKAVEEAWQIA